MILPHPPVTGEVDPEGQFIFYFLNFGTLAKCLHGIVNCAHISVTAFL